MRTEIDIRPVARLRAGHWIYVVCRLFYEVTWMPELGGEFKWRWRLAGIEEIGDR